MAVVEGFELVDLGEHRLRDVSGVEHLFGVVAPGLLSEYPPLRTSLLVPNNLPSPVVGFPPNRGGLLIGQGSR